MRARLLSLHLAPTRENEIVEELSQHLDDRWHEMIVGGASPDEARQLTLAEFSGRDVLANHMAPLRQTHAPTPITLGASTGHVLTDFWQDLRYGTRVFSKQPGFAVAAVLTLALGIGATTAIFSVINVVLLLLLSYPDAERLVRVMEQVVGTTGAPRAVSPIPVNDLMEFRSQATTLTQIAVA